MLQKRLGELQTAEEEWYVNVINPLETQRNTIQAAIDKCQEALNSSLCTVNEESLRYYQKISQERQARKIKETAELRKAKHATFIEKYVLRCLEYLGSKNVNVNPAGAPDDIIHQAHLEHYRDLCHHELDLSEVIGEEGLHRGLVYAGQKIDRKNMTLLEEHFAFTGSVVGAEGDNCRGSTISLDNDQWICNCYDCRLDKEAKRRYAYQVSVTDLDAILQVPPTGNVSDTSSYRFSLDSKECICVVDQIDSSVVAPL